MSKIVGWERYSGEMEGRAYKGYYIYVEEELAKDAEGAGVRVKRHKSAPCFFSSVPMIIVGSTCELYFDEYRRVKEIREVS